MQSVDVAIVGGGMVGLAVPARLGGEQLTRCRTGAAPYRNLWRRSTPPQLRVRLSMPPAKVLTRLGVWQDILLVGLVVITVWKCGTKTSFGHISFDDQSMGYSHLGHIVENSVIHYALCTKRSRRQISPCWPPQVQQVTWGENETFLTLKDGSM
ncbi:hypothetical protein ACNKHX_17565 [Shigella flexneri]